MTSVAMSSVLCRRPAMATLFEVALVGDDVEHLQAVGEAALDEIERIERLISMHDPASELSRLNRLAATEPVKITHEFQSILLDCLAHHEATRKWFDPCHGGPLRFGEAVRFENEMTGHVRLAHPESRIDLGGFGKGLALDCARQIVDDFGVSEYLLQGGTSSVLANGDRMWPVNLRSPGGVSVLGTIHLNNESLSCSANDRVGTAVIAPNAALAEAWSTAILAADLSRVNVFDFAPTIAAAWLESGITWITGGPR
jgi:FAD:protein FMN transferase